MFTEPIKFLWNRKSVSFDPFVPISYRDNLLATCLIHQRINPSLAFDSYIVAADGTAAAAAIVAYGSLRQPARTADTKCSYEIVYDEN